MAGRKPREFSAKEREQIAKLSACGLTQKQIGYVFDCDDVTLQKHCREELDKGAALKIAKVAERAYDRALENDVMAMFFLKCRAGWRETQRHEVGGVDGGPLVVNVNVVPSSE